MSPLRYSIRPKHPAAHLFEVTLTLSDPDPAGQRFMLPVWIPGSYMIREFARHIVTLKAKGEGRALQCEKIDKATWRCEAASGAITLSYEVYAWDLSVRAAHLDQTHGFFNGASVFLLPLGREQAPCEVEILPPAHDAVQQAEAWRVATALPRASAKEWGFGSYRARNYDELIDHPVEMGCFSSASFTACATPHHICISGKHSADLERLCRDVQKICEYQIGLFGAPAPMERYVFLVMAVGEGYGGLEHRASTALLCSRWDLPLAHEAKVSEGYRRLLGLVSHEYFHTWNVKRIKPQAFMAYDLARENYTRQLWAFEGLTSYYDDLTLVRSGLIDEHSYLELLAENIGRVLAESARFKQSVAESSFDAWIKYYRADENAPNAVVSYYRKGAMIGLALDLLLRRDSGGKCSLDDVLRALWSEYGVKEIGVPEGGVEAMAERVSGLDLKQFFARAVYGTEDIDIAALFKDFAIDMTLRPASVKKAGDRIEASLGAKTGGGSDAVLLHVNDGGAAQRAGLSAGDVVMALDGLRVNAATLDKRIGSYAPQSCVVLSIFRRDELMTFKVTLLPQPATTCVLMTRLEPAADKAARLAWLGAGP